MRKRFGAEAGGKLDALPYGEPRAVGGVGLRFLPAGHLLGRAQVVLEWHGCRVVVSGDYQRPPDSTFAPFGVLPSESLVPRDTFGIPAFRPRQSEATAHQESGCTTE